MSPDDDPGTGHSAPVDTTWATACKAVCMNDSSARDGCTRRASWGTNPGVPVMVQRTKLGRTAWRTGSLGWGSGSGNGWPRASARWYMSMSARDRADGGSKPHAQYVHWFPPLMKAWEGDGEPR